MKPKHKCEKCAEWSKEYAERSKYYAEWSKEYANKCQCEVEE